MKPLSVIQPISGSEIISIIFPKKMAAPTDAIDKEYFSAYNAGNKIITGKVGIANANAGEQYIRNLINTTYSRPIRN